MEKVTSVVFLTLRWLFFLGVVYASYRYIWKDSMPNLFYRGWGSLEARYSTNSMPAPAESTSVRVGSDMYQGTMKIVLGEQGVYLQRPTLGKGQSILFIPYAQWKLVEPPKERTGTFGVGTYGIFTVDKTDIWLDTPYANHVIARLVP